MQSRLVFTLEVETADLCCEVSGDATLVVDGAYRIDQPEEARAKPWEEQPFGVEAQTWGWLLYSVQPSNLHQRQSTHVSTEPRRADLAEAALRSLGAAGQRQAQAALWASFVAASACGPSAMQVEQGRRARRALETAAVAKRGAEWPRAVQVSVGSTQKHTM